MNCEYCGEFVNPLYEFEEGKGWYCKAACFLAATNQRIILKKASQR
jgi:hypothetical protein